MKKINSPTCLSVFTFAVGAVAVMAAGACAASDGAATAGKPAIFAPGVISGPANDADPAFTPDGNTLFFARNSTIMVSHRTGNTWSAPAIAAFSGLWSDLQPTMSPDGSFMVFVSNRPVDAGGNGSRPAGNLWRVERKNGEWGEPVHLPATVNGGNSIWAPSIAGDGSLYFIERENAAAPFRLWRSQWKDGNYQAAAPVSFGDTTTQDVDPAVAPDESFIIFGSMHPGPDQHERLFIAFKENGRWGKPVDLGGAVNGDGASDTNEARLSADHRSLYFSSDRTTPVKFPRTRAQAEEDLSRIGAWDNGNQNIWSISLAPWLDARKL
ncbi:MAG: hypothetical protein V4634_00740 [Pseudomonadota bacterium]